MMLDAIIDDFKLSDFGISLAKRPVIPIAEQEVIYHEGIDELDGALTEYGSLKNRTFDLLCNMLEDVPILAIIRQFRAKLLKDKEYTLSLSDDLGYYYLVKHFKLGNIESEIAEHGEFKISVTADPYDYKVEPIEIIGINSLTVENKGTALALPVIKITGLGTVSLNVGNYSLTIDDLNGEVVIDSEKLDYYDPVRPNVRIIKLHTKAFPKLTIGNNLITTKGNVTNLSVKFRERFR
ncbi:phage tail domain-containing protein [Streptococcus pyogenes]|uniref:Phage-related protein n=2 Tax=Streptococcus TaxID=1301 RepID=A0ABU0A689_STRDY|nr:MULTISPECIES: phage tail domain-containing protein [Streptococcus]MDQ0262798.1 phage-related protein [Streptococcus dysgalactiae]QCK31487.1 phage tail protein [Streptococcus pyogenes]QQC55112.1 phage tail family protein [Streptococcus dysgalactiae]HEP1658645.1 phage tail family protein [Streptococcus pyogenes]HEP1697535.1 phage tail family protein [Streptococcus pyogenes]